MIYPEPKIFHLDFRSNDGWRADDHGATKAPLLYLPAASDAGSAPTHGHARPACWHAGWDAGATGDDATSAADAWNAGQLHDAASASAASGTSTANDATTAATNAFRMYIFFHNANCSNYSCQNITGSMNLMNFSANGKR